MVKTSPSLYQELYRRRNRLIFGEEEEKHIAKIHRATEKGNRDNISRTSSYEKYYFRHPEIEWALLAAMVSRNAGWNMTDLKNQTYRTLLSGTYRQQLFATYERANWLIFADAFPQLLVYSLSKRKNRPLFHLLKAFSVSVFMEAEWMRFWNTKDRRRLAWALVINEQHLIQKPVLEHPFYKEKVFQSIPFRLQDWLHFNTVIFPTTDGRLFGFSVHNFRRVKERITLGKRLHWLLFTAPEHKLFRAFILKQPHTGSRYDYEQFISRRKVKDQSPPLRFIYPVITHKKRNDTDWYFPGKRIAPFFRPVRIPKRYHVTDWYLDKREQLHELKDFHQHWNPFSKK